MTIRSLFPSIVVLCVTGGLAGCQQPTTAPAVDRAAVVDDWPGIEPLTRAGRMYFGGQPSAEALAAAPAHGVTTVINLRGVVEMDERVPFDEAVLVEASDLIYVHIPITSASFSVADADAFATALRAAEGNVLLHCASSNRVGALWAVYLHRYRDLPLETAMDHGRAAGMRSGAEAMVHRALEAAQ